MPQRSVAANYTFEQQRQEINLLAADFWTQKTNVDNAASTYLKHDGSNAYTGATLAVPNAFTINSNSGAGTLTISGNLNVTGTTTTVNTTNLEVTDKNILIAKGSTSDANSDGAGITIDSATDITWNFVDAKDAWVSSIGVEATTFVKGPYGQFTGSGTPTTGYGVEVNAPDENTGQITSYHRGNSAYKELRIKGSSVGVYTGTTNALAGTFNSTGLTLESGKRLGVGVAPASGEGSELAVKGSDGATNIALIPSADTEFSQISFYNAAYDSTQGYIKYNNNDNSLSVRVNLAERLSIDSDGVITSSATHPHIILKDPANRQVSLRAPSTSNNAALGTDSSHSLSFYTNGYSNERLRITSDGNLEKKDGGSYFAYNANGYYAKQDNYDNTGGKSYWYDGASGNSNIVAYIDGQTGNIRAGGKLLVGTTNTNSTLTISSGASANAVSIRNTTLGNGNVGILFSTQDHSGGREKAAIYHQEVHGQAHYGGDFIFCLANSTGGASQVAPSDERMRINRFGEVFIGDSSANTTTDRSTLLSVSGTHQDPGGVWTQVGIYSSDGQAEGKGGSIGFGGQDGTTTKQQFASIIGSKENGTSGNYAGNLKFYTRPNGAVSTQALRITSEQSIVATRPGPLSYGNAENYLVFNFDDEASVLDGNANFNTHRVFTAGRTGPFRITCSMKIDSGPYYFVYDVYNSRTGQKLNADGASSTNCRWTDNLASGEGSSVHGFRRFSIPCNADGDGVRPGDNIELRMGSAAANGDLVSAPGTQNTRCKNFRVYSTVPMKEDGGLNYHPCPAAFHVVMGGQNKTFGQNDYFTWDSVSYQRGHVVANENNDGSSTATKGFDLSDNSWKVPYTGIYAFYLNMFCNVDSTARVALTIDGTAYQSGYIWGINSNEGNATPNQAGFQTLFLGAGSVIKVQCTSGSVNSTYGGHTSWGGFLVG